jgi:hypothetical protein
LYPYTEKEGKNEIYTGNLQLPMVSSAEAMTKVLWSLVKEKKKASKKKKKKEQRLKLCRTITTYGN